MSSKPRWRVPSKVPAYRWKQLWCGFLRPAVEIFLLAPMKHELRAQKSPQGLCRAGFQDFYGWLWNHSWRSLNWLCNLLFNS